MVYGVKLRDGKIILTPNTRDDGVIGLVLFNKPHGGAVFLHGYDRWLAVTPHYVDLPLGLPPKQLLQYAELVGVVLGEIPVEYSA